MKKVSDSRVARLMISAVNIPKWTDYKRMKSFTIYLLDCIKKLFVPQQEKKPESFDKAIQEYGLTDAVLLKRRKGYLRACIIMCVCALLFLGYSIYHVLMGSWRAVLVSFVMTILSLTLAFRYHFWFFQITERKLGCSLKEWFKYGLLRESK